MPHDVFINHATAGKLTAYAICSQLESIGIRCWILPRDLNMGIAWDQSIADAVKSCRLMILVLSDYATRSDRVERQLELAFNHGVIVIPFRIEPNSLPSEGQSSLDSVHWLDTVTPETAQRLSSLCNLVGGVILPRLNNPLPVRTLTIDQEKAPFLRLDGCPEMPNPEAPKDEMLKPETAVAEPLDSAVKENTVSDFELADASQSPGKRSRERPEKTSRWLLTKALLLTLVPFAVICGLGFWHANKRTGKIPPRPQAAASASVAPPVAVKVYHLDKFAAANPGWGTLDANWAVADDKLRVTPLLNSSAILINHKAGFTDAEISAEVVMSKGEDLDQLGGLIFWAKDYNDCYALVISADGKFALGRKLVGRWINPIAKTGNGAIKTGVGENNKLRVRTEGSLLTAFINDVQVASLTGEPPQGTTYIGLYGESSETTQNVWEFGNITVSSVR
jgi:hypothetical protein